MIELAIRLPLGPFELAVDCRLDAQVTAVVGPSGSGKTSLLEAIAGLRRRTTGRITVGDDVLLDTSAGIRIPPEHARIGYVPQDSALFPHLDARSNIAFGANDPPRLRLLAEILELERSLDRYPRMLSGGEKQRVALARALMISPRLLLLDEPLAGLDQPLKEKVLVYLRRIRQEIGTPMMYVTHHPLEALVLSQASLLLDRGRVVALGPSEEVIHGRAVSGEEIVENVVEVHSPVHHPARGLTFVETAEGMSLSVAWDQVRDLNFPLVVRISGDDILLFTEQPRAISARNVIMGRIEEIESRGGKAVLKVGTRTPLRVRLTQDAVESLGLRRGIQVWLALRTRSFRVVG